MLYKITIDNIALINHIEIEFKPHLNVLSGETGAGKSLIIDSISLLLGERADKTLISHGKSFAFVEAVFTDISDEVSKILASFGIEDCSPLVINRKITMDGKNECRVNGQMFTLAMLKKVTGHLIDLHGQFQHQSLLNPETHIEILDQFDQDNILPLKEQFASILEEYVNKNKELSAYTVDEKEREHLIDLYKFQISEIEDANFKENEIEELKEKQIKISHAEKIEESLNVALNQMSEMPNNAINAIRKAFVSLSDIKQYDPRVEEYVVRLDSVRIELDDINSSLASMVNEEHFSQEEIDLVEKRLDLFANFKKKYGQTIEEINCYYNEIKEKYQKLNNCSETVERLLKEKAEIEQKMLSIGRMLHERRKHVAQVFQDMVVNELSEVGLNGSKFIVNLKELELPDANSNGLSEVEFMFSANIGQPPKPISKVISGGEMSRFMLALKSLTADKQNINTMIFDEIDTGVSGHISQVLAQKMQKIGQKHQVLCVTHMAQICAFADNNYYISKSVCNNQTQTEIRNLTEEEKIKEVARLIGSSESITAINHANELIALSETLKNQ